MGEWQPIETAPRSGTDILAAIQVRDTWNESEKAILSVIRWHSSEWHEFIPWDDDLYKKVPKVTGGWVRRGLQSYSSEAVYPTHWMPLPSLPTGDAQ